MATSPIASLERRKYQLGVIGALVAVVIGLVSVVALRTDDTMETRGQGLQWKVYDATMLGRLAPDAGKPAGRPRRALELVLSSQHRDARLEASLFVVTLSDAGQRSTVYHGPFKERLRVEVNQPMDAPGELGFWAFHEPSLTYFNWSSLRSWPLEGEQLRIELYDSYNEDAEGWFRVR